MKTARRPGGLRRIVWLPSWPRSGNTWTRILLANYLADSGQPVSINEIRQHLPEISSFSREDFEQAIGVTPEDLTDDEAETFLPALVRSRARRTADAGATLFSKAHDAFRNTSAGEPLFPEEVTLGAVYILRNPLDVVVSRAFYSGRDVAECIDQLNDPRTVQGGARANQFLQRPLDWSGHVRSWTAAPFPVLVVRYEDLLADTVGQLRGIVRFLRLEGAADEDRLRRAAAFSSFARLREREDREGFRGHRWNHRHPFFRSGESGGWRRHLTPAQARRVVHAHAGTMEAFGYDVELLSAGLTYPAKRPSP